MSNMVSGRRRTILMFFLLVMFGALALGYLMTFHLDTIRRMVQQEMVNAFGQNLKVADIQVAFFPYPRLTLTDLQILEAEKDRALFQASRIQIDLSFLSVMQDELVPKGLKVENPELYLRRNEQGQWNAASIFQNHPSGADGVGALLSDYTLTITNGFIQIVDALHSPRSEKLDLSQIELEVSNLSDIEPMDLSLSAHLNNSEASQLSLEGTLSEAMELFAISSEKKQPSGPNLDLRIGLELEQPVLFQIARFFHIEDNTLIPHGGINAQSQLNYAPHDQGFELVLSDVLLLSDVIDLQGQVSVTGLRTSAPPKISATWASAPIDIKDIIDLVPAHLIPDGIQPGDVNQLFKGKIEAVAATLSGSTREDVGFILTGEFKLSEGYVDLGKKWGAAETIEGTVLLQSNRVEFKNFKGTYDSILVASSKGDIQFRDTGPWLSTELYGEVPARKLLEVLRTLFDWTKPNHTMAGFVGSGGSGNMMIRFAGPLRQPDQISLEHARYEPEQAAVHFPGIEGPITDVSGAVIFSQNHVSFESLEGILGANPVSLQGTIKFQDSGSFDTLKLLGRVTVEELVTQFREFSTPIQEMASGSAFVTATLSGPIDTPRVHTVWNLEELELSLSKILNKKRGIKGTLEADVEFQDGKRLNIHRMTLSLPPLNLTGKGLFNQKTNGVFTASVNTSPFDVSSFPQGLTLFDGSLEKGAVEFTININGQGDDWRQWNKKGWFSLTDGTLMIDGLDISISNVFLPVRFDRHMAEIKGLQFEMEQSQAMVSGVIKNWETEPKVKFEMKAPNFDLDLLIPKGGRSPLRDVLESIAATQTVGGKMTFGRAWYKDLNFQDLHGRLQIKNSVIGVDQISGKVEQGTVKGRVLINLPVQEPATVKTWINMEDVSLAPLEQTFFSEEFLDDHLITGNLSIQGMLEGHGKGDQGVVPSLNGQLKVLMKDGRIRRGTIIPKMLTLMNLPALLQGKIDLNKEGYPFDKQAATVTIKNGIMTSKDILMDGPILKLTGAGTYNLVDDQLDLAVAASPFGPYFKLLRKISLFRLLLEGEQESIGMALFDVKGPIHEPVIKPLPLESFKSGLTGFAELAFNVLKNTVALPKNILFPKNSSENELPSDE